MVQRETDRMAKTSDCAWYRERERERSKQEKEATPAIIMLGCLNPKPETLNPKETSNKHGRLARSCCNVWWRCDIQCLVPCTIFWPVFSVRERHCPSPVLWLRETYTARERHTACQYVQPCVCVCVYVCMCASGENVGGKNADKTRERCRQLQRKT